MALSIKLLATVTEADAILGSDDLAWAILDSAQKEIHLANATIYLQEVYNLGDYRDAASFETADVPELIKDACALLAKEDAIELIYARDTSTNGQIEEESVEVGPVKKSTKYKVPNSKWEDQFPMITGLLSRYYPKLRGNGITVVPLLRR